MLRFPSFPASLMGMRVHSSGTGQSGKDENETTMAVE